MKKSKKKFFHKDFKELKKETIINLKKFKKNVQQYFKTNKLFVTFILTTLINGCLVRFLTVKNFFAISPVLADLAFLLLIGAFGYFIKPKNQFKYYFTWTIIFTFLCIVNSMYYTNYISYASFSLLSTSLQVVDVGDAVVHNVMEIKDFCYLWAVVAMLFMNRSLKKKKYYTQVSQIEVGKVRVLNTLVACVIVLGFFLSTLTPTDISRLNKQWNREYVVMKFGIFVYQFNDLFASLKPQISPLFGYDQAAKSFREYYSQKEKQSTNEYTNKYKGKNVIVIHAESIQNYLLGLKVNDQEITPNLNRISKEGLYFSNFYAQESVGTSSDTEFTFATSLMPATNGTVFVSYWDRQYETIQKLMDNEGYYTFSMHGNKGNFWNRNVVHKKFGYQHFYYYNKDYKLDDMIGLGLSDKSFFRQSTEIMKKIAQKHDKFYGTLIMLTNHTPFTGLEDSKDLDLTYKYTKTNSDGSKEEVVNNYLEGRTLGNYFKTAHYADAAIGELFDELDTAGLLDNTIVVIYGDHDAKIKRAEYDYFYNYDPETDSKLSKDNPNYDEYDSMEYNINRKVPFIIWSKNDQQKKEVSEVMGMYDVLPTLGNMLGISSKYALGHDIFSTTNNVVPFANGSWVTDNMYYDAQKGEGRLLKSDSNVSVSEIKKNSKYASKMVDLSNDIIVHDLIKKTTEQDKAVKENK